MINIELFLSKLTKTFHRSLINFDLIFGIWPCNILFLVPILCCLYRSVLNTTTSHLLIPHFLIHSVFTTIILKSVFLYLYIIHDIWILISRINLFKCHLTGEIFRSLGIQIYFQIIFHILIESIHKLDLMIYFLHICYFPVLFQLFIQLLLFQLIINSDFLQIIGFVNHTVYIEIFQIIEAHQIYVIVFVNKEVHLHCINSHSCISFYKVY